MKKSYGFTTISLFKEDAVNRRNCHNSKFCKVVNLGKSNQGVEIYGYIIKGQVSESLGYLPKRIDIVSGMHGDEQTALYLTNKLLELLIYASNKESHNNIYYILPLSNPDAIIKNKRLLDQDLNRVFIKNNKIDNSEEAAILKFLDKDKNLYKNRLLLSIHAGDEGVLYPPGEMAYIDNIKRFNYEALGKEYCEVLASSKNKCPIQSYFDYQTVGELADYYDKTYGDALTLEVTGKKKLESDDIPGLLKKADNLKQFILNK